jgi:hypothetical protein
VGTGGHVDDREQSGGCRQADLPVAAGSLLWLGVSGVRATKVWIDVILVATLVLFAAFAFACGSVIVRNVGTR